VWWKNKIISADTIACRPITYSEEKNKTADGRPTKTAVPCKTVVIYKLQVTCFLHKKQAPGQRRCGIAYTSRLSADH